MNLWNLRQRRPDTRLPFSVTAAVIGLGLAALTGCGGHGDAQGYEGDGTPMAVLESARSQMVSQLKAIQASQDPAVCDTADADASPPDLYLLVQQMSPGERDFCRKVLFETIPEILQLHDPANPVPFSLSADTLYVQSAGGQLPVNAMTQLGPGGSIIFNINAVLSLSPQALIATEIHESLHKIAFSGASPYLSDSTVYAAFLNGSVAMSTIGAVVALYKAGSWIAPSGPTSVGAIIGTPAAVPVGGTVAVFAIGLDHQVHENLLGPSGAGGWSPAIDPVAVGFQPGVSAAVTTVSGTPYIYLAATGLDGLPYFDVLSANGDQGWTAAGTMAVSGVPAITIMPTPQGNCIALWVVDWNGKTYYSVLSPAATWNPVDASPVLGSLAAVAVPGSDPSGDYVAVFARLKSDSAIHEVVYSAASGLGHWGPAIGNFIASGTPSATYFTSGADTTLTVVAPAAGGGISWNASGQRGWAGWSAIPGTGSITLPGGLFAVPDPTVSYAGYFFAALGSDSQLRTVTYTRP
jgi:hypothetical protein